VTTLPVSLRWIFWDVDFDELEPEKHADGILARVLERGRLEDVRAILDLYGERRILEFFRHGGGPDLSDRTRQFWRAFFQAENNEWPNPPAWRRSFAAPWIG
jgi:Family of unknown function (DUF6922)